jgi:hypothetical protein
MAQTKTKRTANASARRNANRTNSRTRTGAAKRAVKNAQQGAGRGMAQAANKAKTPAIAGAAALAGLAGGVALARNGSGRKVGGVRIPRMPQLNRAPSTGKALASAASEIGKAGYKLGELTTEVRRVREQATEKK